MKSSLFIGIMSGTSLDGVDTVLVDFSQTTPALLHAINVPIPNAILQKLLQLRQPDKGSIHELAELDHQLGHLFADSAQQLMTTAKCKNSDIAAIGCHGQTIRHQPNAPLPYTVQIGDPNIIAAKTGITTVADFRRKDLALGGQGAPLVPAFHELIWRNGEINRVIVNIGGIANLTWLPKNPHDNVVAFDTGPGNTLMNAWIQQHQQRDFDDNGAWAATGTPINRLVETALADSYFHAPFPKSTGTDYFNLSWLVNKLQAEDAPHDVQATLLELTALAIANSIDKLTAETCEIVLCGGGANNSQLLKRIQILCQPNHVTTSQDFAISVDWLEAIAFAWLAQRTLAGLTSNVPTATGARTNTILGGIYQA